MFLINFSLTRSELGAVSIPMTSIADPDTKVAPEKPLSDEEQLAALGHVQELRREFSLWSIVCLQISLMATWEALSSVVATALTNGGAPCLFYN